jgi:hypothetical protein
MAEASWLVLISYPNSKLMRTRLAMLRGETNDVIRRAREYWPEYRGRMIYRKLKFNIVQEVTLFTPEERVDPIDDEPVEPPPPFHVPQGDLVANADLACIKAVYGDDWATKYELGAPAMTSRYTVQELTEMGYCGVYLRSGPKSKQTV